jgi:hypothetical protein
MKAVPRDCVKKSVGAGLQTRPRDGLKAVPYNRLMKAVPYNRLLKAVPHHRLR